jgi:hypothetical protein
MSSYYVTTLLSPCSLLQDKFRRLQQEISDLQNVEEPQSEDLKPLVGTHI